MSNQSLYEKIFKAKEAGNNIAADKLMKLIESKRIKDSILVSSTELQKIKTRLPKFALEVLNKNQFSIDQKFKANCINAAFNFKSEKPRFKPYSTMEFLKIIQDQYSQLIDKTKFQLGDLVVMWSRSGGSWDDREILVSDINVKDPDFPYGLVFDHIAVILENELVFHKPDPTLESLYRVDYFESAISVTKENIGFELTYHRLKI